MRYGGLIPVSCGACLSPYKAFLGIHATRTFKPRCLNYLSGQLASWLPARAQRGTQNWTLGPPRRPKSNPSASHRLKRRKHRPWDWNWGPWALDSHRFGLSGKWRWLVRLFGGTPKRKFSVRQERLQRRSEGKCSPLGQFELESVIENRSSFSESPGFWENR